MSTAVEGNLITVLKIPTITTPANSSWDASLPPHSWEDSAAAGKSGVMTYCNFTGIPPGVNELDSLPTFQMAAQYAAKANWPLKLAEIGDQTFPADATGNPIPGSEPVIEISEPYRQLRADEYVVYAPGMPGSTIPEVVTSAASVDTVVGPGGFTQAQNQTLLDAANKVLGV